MVVVADQQRLTQLLEDVDIGETRAACDAVSVNQKRKVIGGAIVDIEAFRNIDLLNGVVSRDLPGDVVGHFAQAGIKGVAHGVNLGVSTPPRQSEPYKVQVSKGRLSFGGVQGQRPWPSFLAGAYSAAIA